MQFESMAGQMSILLSDSDPESHSTKIVLLLYIYLKAHFIIFGSLIFSNRWMVECKSSLESNCIDIDSFLADLQCLLRNEILLIMETKMMNI